MKCRKCCSLMALAAGGDLPSKENMEVEEHLIECQSCRESYTKLRRSLELARSLVGQQMSIEIESAEWERIIGQVITQENTVGHPTSLSLARWIWRFSFGLLFLMAVAAGVIFIKQRNPSEGDAGNSWLATSLRSQPKSITAITYTSQETGLTIYWYVNERLNYGEVGK